MKTHTATFTALLLTTAVQLALAQGPAAAPPAGIPPIVGAGAPLPPTAPPAGIAPPVLNYYAVPGTAAPRVVGTGTGTAAGGIGVAPGAGNATYFVPATPPPPAAGGPPAAANIGGGVIGLSALPPLPAPVPVAPTSVQVPGTPGNFGVGAAPETAAPGGGLFLHHVVRSAGSDEPSAFAASSAPMPRNGQEIIREAKLRVLQRHYEETLNQMIQLEKDALSASPEDREKMEATAQAMQAFLSKLEAELVPLADRPKGARTTPAILDPTPRPGTSSSAETQPSAPRGEGNGAPTPLPGTATPVDPGAFPPPSTNPPSATPAPRGNGQSSAAPRIDQDYARKDVERERLRAREELDRQFERARSERQDLRLDVPERPALPGITPPALTPPKIELPRIEPPKIDRDRSATLDVPAVLDTPQPKPVPGTSGSSDATSGAPRPGSFSRPPSTTLPATPGPRQSVPSSALPGDGGNTKNDSEKYRALFRRVFERELDRALAQKSPAADPHTTPAQRLDSTPLLVAPKIEIPKIELPRIELPRIEPLKADPFPVAPPKVEPLRELPPQLDPPKPPVTSQTAPAATDASSDLAKMAYEEYLRAARERVDRAVQLYQAGGSSPQDFVAARRLLAAAQANSVKVAEASLAEAKQTFDAVFREHYSKPSQTVSPQLEAAARRVIQATAELKAVNAGLTTAQTGLLKVSDEQKNQSQPYTGAILEQGTRGRVLAVNSRWAFAVINIGGQQGAAVKKALVVRRNGQAIGKIRISSVEPNQSIADIVPDSFIRDTSVQPGDEVIFAGDEKVEAAPNTGAASGRIGM